MNGILRLNDCDVRSNPVVWSHDPSMMWDEGSQRYYSYSTDIYRPMAGLDRPIGIPVRSSEDLVNFRYEGTVLSDEAIAQGRDNGNYPPTVNFWAPFVECVHGEYRMYYSATRAFGSSESRIWLAVSNSPLGPFENRGVVVDSWGTDDTLPNAIDPHIIRNETNCYLVYGSFFGGIYLKELDEKTGLALDGCPQNLGKCISRKARNPKIDGPEGASVIYVPETGYFYLFQSYGWLGDNYDIRVGRSRNAEGPYCDYSGRDLVEESMGMKLAGSYCFRAGNPYAKDRNKAKDSWKWGGFRGPGHGVPFYDPRTGQYFFVHHIRDGAEAFRSYSKEEERASYSVHYMMIRPMFFEDGWPVFAPEPYQGENFEPVSPEEAAGRWEILILDDEDNDIKYAKEYDLDSESMYLNKGKIYRCQDLENQKETLAVTGLDNSGIAYWGKFMYSIV